MNENITKRTTNEPDDVGFAAFSGRLYVDRRAEDYKFTIREQGEKMNEVKDERKQVAQKSVELTLSINYLEKQIEELITALEKVLRPVLAVNPNETGEGLVPLAAYLDKEINRISVVSWKLDDIIQRIEL